MAGDYDPAFFADLARMQDRHFWYRGRNRLIAHLVQQESGRNAGRFRFLDAGCGTGGVLKYLERNETGAHLVGMDLFPEALEYARAQVGSPLVRGSVAHVPFDASINAVGAFDVIEHLDDARRCAAEHAPSDRRGRQDARHDARQPGTVEFFR